MGAFRSIRDYFVTAAAELRRVVWPTRQEVIRHTLIIATSVIVATILLGLVDLGLTDLLRRFITRQ